MKSLQVPSLLLSFLLIACGNNHDIKIHTAGNQKPPAEAGIPEAPYTLYNAADDPGIGKTYVPTGFYYLTNNEGIKMMKDRSQEVYNLNRLPFVGVENMASVKTQEEPLQQGTYTALEITLDKEGTRSLAEGTGNPAYPYIAVVIGGRLLYVVKNVSKIPSGVMSIYVQGYTQAQIDGMEMAIRRKR